MSTIQVKRALVSVYDKTGLAELGQALQAAGVEVVSTGSTAARLREAGVDVVPVDQVTGFPECLDGRVKTLHPKVHAGILADRRLPDHVQQLADLDVAPFDLVVVNLYPFSATVASGAAPDECVEQIDIGGPTMVRAAAKNHPSVAVVVDPSSYGEVVQMLDGGSTFEQRRRLASLAFQHTAAYDVAVASWFANTYDASGSVDGFPDFVGATWERSSVLRYGENPHQSAALYLNGFPGLAAGEQLHGKEMSYNNYVDGDAAWRAAHDHGDAPTVAIIKHANPCGIAVGTDVAEAHRRAHACDPVSAFGGVIATNVPVSLAMAEQVAEVFTEVVLAPGYADGAVEVLAAKKNIRILVVEPLAPGGTEFRRIDGGLLVQQRDTVDAEHDRASGWTLACGEAA
ncbi:MAG: purH, partial [Frankiales bacterium]|nr:purH [Frankiales bacterium]